MFAPNRFPGHRTVRRTVPAGECRRIFRWPGHETRGTLNQQTEPLTAETTGPQRPPCRPAQSSENPMRYLRHILCVAILACLSVTPEQGAAAGPAGLQESESARLPEVRLRKLHLVRPDLIPYPIAYDVYC